MIVRTSPERVEVFRGDVHRFGPYAVVGHSVGRRRRLDLERELAHLLREPEDLAARDHGRVAVDEHPRAVQRPSPVDRDFQE